MYFAAQVTGIDMWIVEIRWFIPIASQSVRCHTQCIPPVPPLDVSRLFLFANWQWNELDVSLYNSGGRYSVRISWDERPRVERASPAEGWRCGSGSYTGTPFNLLPFGEPFRINNKSALGECTAADALYFRPGRAVVCVVS